jgi:hypothetical protein
VTESPEQPTKKRPWWVATQGLKSAIVLTVLWALIGASVVARRINDLSPMWVIALIVYAVTVVGFGSSIVYWSLARNRR